MGAGAEERLWLFNPLVVADVLDEDRSELYRGAASGRITGIKRWVFHDDRLDPLGAFLVPQSSHLCLTGEPLGRLLAAGLSGLALFNACGVRIRIARRRLVGLRAGTEGLAGECRRPGSG